jgi:hypothetical protein|tara:strand:+ start:156 stop:356 length:201 start_codon:yes stop_codon:yes gene_type:complete
MYDAIPVALEGRAVHALWFVMKTAAASLRTAGVCGKVRDGVHTSQKLPALPFSGNHPLNAERIMKN